VNYNFTDSVRKVLNAARREAQQFGCDYVGTEHLLLGALTDAGILLLLGRLGVRPEEIDEVVRRQIKPYDPPRRGSRPRELSYTSRAKKVLELAMSEARESKDDHVGPEHLLVGLIGEGDGIGATALAARGVTLARVRAARAGESFKESGGFHVRIDDGSDRSIYEQIVAQVTEAIATGTLQPGERLPTVRQLADELDIAPGTVARAYGELEREKRIVTEGARGTRVAERIGVAPRAGDRRDTLAGLLRPVAVAAFHLGGSADELRAALEEAMRGIFDRAEDAA
jgi:DNA-binding transcriptional regulator YhcF (GntR family)